MQLPRPRPLVCSLGLSAALVASVAAQDPRWVVYEGGHGPGRGKHIVFVSGDEEYRSEETCPMLARILAVHHGFRCTVLFAIDPDTGAIDPDHETDIPGLEALEGADMMVIFTRFRELPDEQMKYVDAFVNSGKPILGLRTATHAFRYQRHPDSEFARYDFRSKEWPGGFGRQVLGETWVAHHGHHGAQSTRGVVEADHADHPILRGVTGVWGPTDVYAVRDLPGGTRVLMRGQVLDGMKPDALALAGKKNDPMMPLVWVREFTGRSGKPSRVICTTMGASVDCRSEGLRRLLVNACYWGLGMEAKIPAVADVDYVGDYEPTPFGFGKYRRGVVPAAFAWPPPKKPDGK